MLIQQGEAHLVLFVKPSIFEDSGLNARIVDPGPHHSGRIAVVGHTPQKKILHLGHLICLDTGCAYGGRLAAMEMGSGAVWQARTME
jgi:hypothetical protein